MLAECRFRRCDLREAQFDAATEFAGGVFARAQFPAGLDLRGKSLAGCDFSGCDLREAQFDAATEFAVGWRLNTRTLQRNTRHLH